MDSTVRITSDAPTDGAPAPTVDARPILRRTQDNLWDRTERLRSQLYQLIEDNCRTLGIEALVLQSDPYVHPAWVKVEAWKPERGGTLTARSSMMVSLTAMPYHLYEAVYRVEWHKQGRQGTTDHLYAFREGEVARMLRFLVTTPGLPLFGNGEVKWILDSGQLRTVWWHLWKPRNRVVALRPDFVRGGSAALLAVGTLMVAGDLTRLDPYDGYAASGDVAYDTTITTVPGTDTVSTAPIADSVVPLLPVYASDTTMGWPTADSTAAPATGTGTGWLAAYQEASGFLNGDDSRFSDTSGPYDEWRYHGQGGERIVVTLRSGVGEALLLVGQNPGQGWTELASSGASGGTEAQVDVTFPATGEYLIVAGIRQPAAPTGYAIRVDPMGSAWP